MTVGRIKSEKFPATSFSRTNESFFFYLLFLFITIFFFFFFFFLLSLMLINIQLSMASVETWAQLFKASLA